MGFDDMPRRHPREVLFTEAQLKFQHDHFDLVKTFGEDYEYKDEVRHLALLVATNFGDSSVQLPEVIPTNSVDLGRYHKIATNFRMHLKDCTVGEKTMAVAMMMSSLTKYWIRVERHGDASKPGGLE